MKAARSAILNVWSVILDAILPLRARTKRTNARAAEDFRLSPTVHDLLGSRITTLMDYRDKSVRDLIQSLKYDRGAHAASLAAKLLEEYLLEEISSHRAFSQRKVLLIPIPLHKSRMKYRGYNQIELVVRALPREYREGPLAHLASDLRRVRETKQQTRLHRSERLGNVAGAFAVREGANLKDAHIFLIDDVTTTGATLVNAATPLRRAGAYVSLLALARA